MKSLPFPFLPSPSLSNKKDLATQICEGDGEGDGEGEREGEGEGDREGEGEGKGRKGQNTPRYIHRKKASH